jgi:triacylglycerol esterase/lipase EstA (alpha/beta hydrolase family)
MDPILFVHGFGSNDKQYQPLIRYLEQKGIKKFYEFVYDSSVGLHPIKTIAKELAEYIAENVKEENINIIGISQGGIIALAYLKDYKNLPAQAGINVKKLFTLCSPHKGSRLAKLLNLPGIIDLRPNSKLLKELEIFAQNEKIDIYSVYTPFDLMVFPGN